MLRNCQNQVRSLYSNCDRFEHNSDSGFVDQACGCAYGAGAFVPGLVEGNRETNRPDGDQNIMRAEGQQFLDLLAAFPPKSFESDFSKSSTRLGLGRLLQPEELSLLLDAAFYAGLCNIAINGLGGCRGQIKPNRIRLEQEFMAARDAFFACDGWAALHAAQKGSVERIFLKIEVSKENFAW